jgi:hypothetical protein
MRILFLGPCSKQNRKTGSAYVPFSPETPSGRYVSLLRGAISAIAPQVQFSASNILEYPFFEPGGLKEKNPSSSDLVGGWAQFERRIQKIDPTYIVGFGSNVRQAFSLIDLIDYAEGQIFLRRKKKLIFSPHPSFIVIYRRKRMHSYISLLASLIGEDAAGRRRHSLSDNAKVGLCPKDAAAAPSP